MENDHIILSCLSNVSSIIQKKKKYTYIRRTKKIRRVTVFEQLMVPSILNSIVEQHCPNRCFEDITYNDVKKIRMEYLSKNREQKNIWLVNYLKSNVYYIASTRTTRWHIDGKEMCKRCWMLATSVSHYKLKNCYKVFHSSKGISRQTNRMSSALAWLSNYFFFFWMIDDTFDKQDRMI